MGMDQMEMNKQKGELGVGLETWVPKFSKVSHLKPLICPMKTVALACSDPKHHPFFFNNLRYDIR